MKKFFALMLSIAMVVSLFSGVAFAAGHTEAKINLTTKSAILSGNTYATTTVSGNITTLNNALINQTFDLTLVKWVGGTYPMGYWDTMEPVYVGTATGGTFSFIIETNLTDATYFGLLASKTGYDFGEEIPHAEFFLKFNVASSSLQFDYSTNKQEVVMGSVKYADNSIPTGKTVNLYFLDSMGWATGEPIASSAINPTTGSFGFIVADWMETSGNIGLVIDGITHNTGKVNPKALTVTVTPNAGIVHTVQATPLTLEVSGGPVSAELNWEIKKGTVVAYSDTIMTDAAGKIKATVAFDFADTKAGTYTWTLWNDTYKGSATFTVVNPSRYTLVGTENLKEFIIGTNTVTFGPSNDIQLYEADFAGNILPTNFNYTVWVNGTKKFENVTSGTLTHVATQLGNVDVRILVKRADNNAVAYDMTWPVPVVGYAVTVDKSPITVNEEVTVLVTVKDKNGVGVNNAHVVLAGASISTQIVPGVQNIQNGVYSFKIKPTAVGNIAITVYKTANTDVMAQLDKGIVVVGAKVYTVTSDIATLLAGKIEAGTFHVMEGTNKILPDQLEIWVDGVFHAVIPSTPTDTNGDNLADAVKANVLAHCAEKPAVIRASNADGTKVGDFALTIVSPTLVVTGNDKLTAYVKTAITFSVVDPRTNTPLTAPVEFLGGDYLCMSCTEIYNDENIELTNNTVVGATAYTIHVIADDIDWADAAEDKKPVEMSAVITLDAEVEVTGTLVVEKAKLTSVPSTVLIGVPNNLTFTYTDANDNPIKGKDVWLYDTETLIGETDANGQVFYALAQGSSLAVKIAAETDVYYQVTELTIPAGFDMEAPVVTAPASVTTSTAIITITDNTRVHRLMVNGVEINIFPMKTVNHLVNVNTGTNVFHVAAMDNFYNVVHTTVTIVKAAPTGAVLTTVIGQTGYTMGGVTTPTDAALMYNANGDSMMPVRFLEAFGAVITWNQTAGAATFVYGGKTVVVTVGSNVATVNGVAVNMIGASGQAAPAQLVGGRVMVPTRFVSEQLGFTVSWAPPNTVTITAP